MKKLRLFIHDKNKPENNDDVNAGVCGCDDEMPIGEEEENTEEGNTGEEQIVSEDNDGESGPEDISGNEKTEQKSNLSMKEILGGDILTGDWLRRQMGLIIICVLFSIYYITNRYSAQQEQIELERLKVELTEVKYRALTRSSELTVKTRQSKVEKYLQQTPDSMLALPQDPPFIIKSNVETEE